VNIVGVFSGRVVDIGEVLGSDDFTLNAFPVYHQSMISYL